MYHSDLYRDSVDLHLSLNRQRMRERERSTEHVSLSGLCSVTWIIILSFFFVYFTSCFRSIWFRFHWFLNMTSLYCNTYTYMAIIPHTWATQNYHKGNSFITTALCATKNVCGNFYSFFFRILWKFNIQKNTIYLN